MSIEELFTVSETLARLNISYEALRKRVARKSLIPVSGVGQSAMFRASDVIAQAEAPPVTTSPASVQAAAQAHEATVDALREVIHTKDEVIAAKDAEIQRLTEQFQQLALTHDKAVTAISATAVGDAQQKMIAAPKTVSLIERLKEGWGRKEKAKAE